MRTQPHSCVYACTHTGNVTETSILKCLCVARFPDAYLLPIIGTFTKTSTNQDMCRCARGHTTNCK